MEVTIVQAVKVGLEKVRGSSKMKPRQRAEWVVLSETTGFLNDIRCQLIHYVCYFMIRLLQLFRHICVILCYLL